MFGMTKRQFLKKSKKCLDEMGNSLLLLMQLIDKEVHGKISNQEASIKVNIIRKDTETIFSEFEKVNPPYECFSLYRQMLNALIKLHGIVVINSEALTATKEGLEEKSQKKLIESINSLEEFRDDFHRLVKDVKIHLLKK